MIAKEMGMHLHAVKSMHWKMGEHDLRLVLV